MTVRSSASYYTCFQARTPSIRCRLASSDASSMRRRRRRESPSACRRTLCGIAFATPSARTKNVDIRVLSRFCSRARCSSSRTTSALYPRRRQHDPRRYRQPLGPAPALNLARRPPPPPDRWRGPGVTQAGVADIFRTAWLGVVREPTPATSASNGNWKVMSAIETCRTAALGDHVERCNDCAPMLLRSPTTLAGNRHCPKCQGAAARQWLEASSETICCRSPTITSSSPCAAPIAPIAFHNKTVVYDLLFKAAAETPDRHCGQPKTASGARVGFTVVLHNLGLGSHSPPARAHDCARRRPVVGRFALDRPQAPLLLPVRARSTSCPSGRCRACSGGCFSKRLAAFASRPGGWPSSAICTLADRRPLTAALAPLRRTRMGRLRQAAIPRPQDPQRCLPILSGYTHRVAISNSQLSIASTHSDHHSVTFRWKDYRARGEAYSAAHGSRP